MTAVVDELPFPWARREARELHVTLGDLYPSAKGIMWVADAVGLNTMKIDPNQPPFFVWKDVLDLAARSGATRRLLELVLEQNERSPRVTFLTALLEEHAEPIASDYQPRNADGVPDFIAATDDISDQEALLFHDDLTLEFGRIPWLIGVLQGLKKVGAAVCKLQTTTATKRQVGTGFRIGPDLLLTNWHVVYFDALATDAKAEFGYEDDGSGGGLPSMAVACDVSTIKGDAALDWAVIRTAQPLPDAVPIIRLSDAVEPKVAKPAFIIQHPAGERKRVAFVRNQITGFDDRVVHYLSDTQSGSSGSPVLDEQCRLLALHHAGGRPQEVAGRPPLRKNEGIRIPCVAAGLTRLGIELQ